MRKSVFLYFDSVVPYVQGGIMRLLYKLLVAIILFTCSATQQFLHAENHSFAETSQKVIPCIVRIFAETNQQMAKQYMSDVTMLSDNKIYSTGTGFFVSSNGIIATANHVVAPLTGRLLVVTAKDGAWNNELEAKLLYQSTSTDIALLQVNQMNTTHVLLHETVEINLGEEIGFVGFPLEFQYPFLSKTIISSKVSVPIGDNIEACNQIVINNFVNHGNSGGPVFLGDTGEVIGIISWRPSIEVKKKLLDLSQYSSGMSLGTGKGLMDPIKLSAAIYNENLKLIGDTTQFGIGYCTSIEYVVSELKKYK